MRAVVLVLDGWGLGSGDPQGGSGGRDAVAAADTPAVDAYREEGASGTLRTHGRSVGLPEGQMGNSEVGHLTIGAGRVVRQASTRISDAIVEGTLSEVPAIADAIDHVRASAGHLHLMGLVGDGGVHARDEHVHALVRLAANAGVEAVTHAFTDGRDTDPDAGVNHLQELRAVIEEAGTGSVATVCGRYYAMDRDENWERTQRAYNALVNREAEFTAPDPVAAVKAAYDRGTTDEFVEPTLIEDSPGLAGGDACVFWNFRADRARQLARMLADIDPEWGFETEPPDVRLVTMTEYDERFGLPVAFPPRQPGDTLGETIAAAELSQARLAETEKYAHVTYFLNGGREEPFDGERREIVPSPDVSTYDRQPEMSAPELTDRALAVTEDDPDVMIVNYANPDMVGHTGDFEAAVDAVEAVDSQVERLVPACRAAGASIVLTADHGNAEDMGTPDAPHTAHTTNPVPVAVLGPESSPAGPLRPDGGLADVAPTLLELMGLEPPAEMTGRSLLEP